MKLRLAAHPKLLSSHFSGAYSPENRECASATATLEAVAAARKSQIGFVSPKTVEDLLDDFKNRLAVPWRLDEPPAGRVWMLWYDKAHERRVRGRLREFQLAAEQAGKVQV